VPLEVIKFEPVPVVTREDPNWLAKQFGSFPSAIDLALSRFSNHDEWPEFDPTQKYGIAWFKGESFPNFTAVDERLTKEGFGPDRRTFPFHLAIEVVPRYDELWSRCQQGNGPRWIYASSTQSYWRYVDGDLYVPFVGVVPDSRGVYACWVKGSFDGSSGFLVSCE
jgi:hypothetical protein